MANPAILLLRQRVHASKGGELLHYEFWPNYNKTEHTSNESYVEPDLLLEFEYFNLLVEIKRKDVQSYRQYEGQWKK